MTDSGHASCGFYVTSQSTFDDFLSDSGNEEFVFSLRVVTINAFLSVFYAECLAICQQLKGEGFLLIFITFMFLKEVFIKVTISSVINLEIDRSYS